MSNLVERYAGWVVRRPVAALLIALAGTAALGVFLKDARIDNSLRALLPEGDPAIAYYLDVLERFGGAEVLVAAMPCPGEGDCFTPEALTAIDRVTRAVAGLDADAGDALAMRHVVSLTSVVGVSGAGETLSVDRLLPSVPGTPAEREALRRRVLGDRLYRRDLISPDGRVAAVVAYLDAMPGEEQVRVDLVRRFRAAVREATGPDAELHFSGVSIFTTDLYDDVYRDLKLFPVLTVLLVLAMLFWIFRSLSGVLIPQLVIALALGWTFGAFFLLGRPLTLVSVMLPSLLAVIALSVVIHQLTHHLEEVAAGHSPREAVRRTVIAIGPACLLTTVTTMIGFGSLGVADLRPVRDFGFFAAFGVAVSFVLAFLVVPPLLLLLEGAGDGELLARLVDDEFRTARLFCRVPMLPTVEQLDLLDGLQREVAERFPPDLATARVTGGVALYAHTVDRLVRSQLMSFGVAFLLIAALFAIVFRSVRTGAIAMIPNLFPIVVTLGVMGWFGISLNMATTMIASVSLGIAVDDTIHYLMRVRAERRTDPAWPPALERATRFTGRALVSTTAVIAGGFWILLFSSFQVTRYFGILAGLAVVSALAADLVLTPACLILFRPRLGKKEG